MEHVAKGTTVEEALKSAVQEVQVLIGEYLTSDPTFNFCEQLDPIETGDEQP